MLDQLRYYLVLIAEQCLPQTVIGEPSDLDIALIWFAIIAMVGAGLGFARGMLGRDDPRTEAIKRQVLDD